MPNPFVGPTYPLASRPTSVQRTVNMMPVAVEPGNERAGWVFKDVPGLVLVERTIIEPPPEPIPTIWLLNAHVTEGSVSQPCPPWQLSDGDQTVFVPDSALGLGNHYQGNVISNNPKSSGKRYFEQIIASTAFDGSPAINPDYPTQFCYALYNDVLVDVDNGAYPTFGAAESWGFNHQGDSTAHGKWQGWDGSPNVTMSGLPPPTHNGVVMFAIDIDAGRLWMGLDGTWFTGDPSTDTDPIASGMTGTTYNPAFGANRAYTSSTLRSIPADFTYDIPTGFTYWSAE